MTACAHGSLDGCSLDRLGKKVVEQAFVSTIVSNAMDIKLHMQHIDVARKPQGDLQRLIQDVSIRLSPIDAREDMLDGGAIR
jgi:hypothetical protein